MLSLSVTPQITPDDRINLSLTVSKDSQGDDTVGGIPTILTNSVTSEILVDNGETIVLGGIYERTTRNDTTRVPFFGELPVVGYLFRNNAKKDYKNELLVFVTPKILKDTVSLR